jgi:protein import protein ZIM17
MTIEDLMREQGQLVKKGTLSEDGDLEFWSDGSTTKRGEGAGAETSGSIEGEGEGEVPPEDKSTPISV